MKKQLLSSFSAFIFVLLTHSVSAQDTWAPVVTGGFGDVNNSSIKCMQVFKGNIYAGTGDDSAAIYSSSTGSMGAWQRKFSSYAIYGINNFGVTAEGGGYMFATTYGGGSTPSEIYRTADGNTWSSMYSTNGSGDYITYVVPFKGLGTVDSVYVVEQTSTGDIIKRAPYNSNDPLDTLHTWDTVNSNFYFNYINVTSTIVYNGKFYIGANDASLWSTPDGTTWTQNSHVGYGFGDANNYQISALGAYGGYLYAATYNNENGAELWRSDTDSNWVMVTQFPGYETITSITTVGTDLWVAMNNGDSGTLRIEKSSDGLTFNISADNGFGVNGDNGLYAQILSFGSNVYCSTQNYYYSGPTLITAHSYSSHSAYPPKPATRGKSGVSTGGQIWRTCTGTPPVVDLGSNMSICAGQNVILNAGPGSSYYWSTGDTTQTIQAGGSATGTPYYCVVTDAGGCSGSDTVTVKAINVPTIGVVTPYTQHAVICLGDSTTLLNQVTSNYRQELAPMHRMPATDSIFDNMSSYDTLAVTGVNDLASAAIVSVTIDSLYHTYDGDVEIGLYAPDGSYTMLSNQNGDSGDNYIGTVFSASSTADITAFSPPYTGTFAPQGGFSSFSGPANGQWILAVTDHANGDEGAVKGWSMQLSVADTLLSLSWTPATGLSSSTIASPTVTPPQGTTIYTLMATNTGGCSASINDTIVVPVIHMVATHDSICSGSNTLLHVNGAVNPVWSPGATLTGTTGMSQIATPTGTTEYFVSDTVGGCYTPDSLTIFVDAPITMTAGAPQTICMGSSATIIGTVTTGMAPFFYVWTAGGSGLLNGQSQTVTPTTNTTYTLTINDAMGCMNTDSTTVSVRASTDIYGHISYSGGNVANSNVVIYNYQPYLVFFDTLQVVSTDASGNYHFPAVPHANYLIEVFPAATYTALVPSYYGNKYLWDSATIAMHDCMTADTFNIAAVQQTGGGSGPGYLHGRIVKDASFHSGIGTAPSSGHERAPGEPIPGIDVKLGRNPGGQLVTSTMTDGNGEYSFSGVAFGTYTVFANIPGLGRDSSYTFVVDSAQYIYNYLDYTVDSSMVHYVPNAGVSVNDIAASANKLNVYPNPSKGDATVQYTIDKDATVTLGIYNVLGVKVTELVDAHQAAGTYKYSVNDKNSGLRSGVYFVTLVVNGKPGIQRIVITE